MLAYVPVRFDLYRPLKAHLRWTLQCLVAFADRTGRCWPSVRKLAEVSGIGKSTVSRHLSALESLGIIRRTRKPGGVYSYVIDSRYLPAGAHLSQPAPELSHPASEAVPPVAAEEKPAKKISSPAVRQSEYSLWEPRLRSWRKSRFWLPQWGPSPAEAGCWAPAQGAHV